MITRYVRPPPARGVGLLRSDRRVVTEDGAVRRLRSIDDAVRIFGDREVVREMLHRGDGEATCWNSTPIRWHANERDVILLGGYPGEGPDVLNGLVQVRDFLASYGAAIGSAPASSFSLLRATLETPLRTSGGTGPRLVEVVGGRQEDFTGPGHFGSFESWDLQAAYARALADVPYSGRWGTWGGGLPTDLGPVPCFVHARVRVPSDLVAGPLPKRRPRRRQPPPGAFLRVLDEAMRDYPTGRTIQGTWSLHELRAAETVGASVRPLETFVGVGATGYPFDPWWAAVRLARALPGFAGRFAKVIGNTLWGRFCLEGERRRVRYIDGHPRWSKDPLPTMPAYMKAPDLSEAVAARVRARLYTELIVPYADRLIGVHTDGGLLKVRSSGEGQLDLDPDPIRLPRDWRLRAHGDQLVYLNPQVYAYRQPSGKRVYKVSGARPSQAAEMFRGLVSTVRDGRMTT